MSKQKRLLIIKASEDIRPEEINNVVSQVSLYGIESKIEDVFSFERLKTVLDSFNDCTFDYIYLAAHGCEDAWGNVSGDLKVKWIEFAALICDSGISNSDTIFFHSCCRGGVNQVAWSMFHTCPQIQYVCGPRNKISNLDLIIAFNLFLYNVEIREIDPVVAAEKVLAAIDIRLVCFDRVEEIASIGYQKHAEDIDPMITRIFEGLNTVGLVSTLD